MLTLLKLGYLWRPLWLILSALIALIWIVPPLLLSESDPTANFLIPALLAIVLSMALKEHLDHIRAHLLPRGGGTHAWLLVGLLVVLTLPAVIVPAGEAAVPWLANAVLVMNGVGLGLLVPWARGGWPNLASAVLYFLIAAITIGWSSALASPAVIAALGVSGVGVLALAIRRMQVQGDTKQSAPMISRWRVDLSARRAITRSPTPWSEGPFCWRKWLLFAASYTVFFTFLFFMFDVLLKMDRHLSSALSSLLGSALSALTICNAFSLGPLLAVHHLRTYGATEILRPHSPQRWLASTCGALLHESLLTWLILSAALLLLALMTGAPMPLVLGFVLLTGTLHPLCLGYGLLVASFRPNREPPPRSISMFLLLALPMILLVTSVLSGFLIAEDLWATAAERIPVGGMFVLSPLVLLLSLPLAWWAFRRWRQIDLA